MGVNELISIEKAARSLQIGSPILRQAIKNGELKYFSIGKKKKKITMESVNNYISNKINETGTLGEYMKELGKVKCKSKV